MKIKDWSLEQFLTEDGKRDISDCKAWEEFTTLQTEVTELREGMEHLLRRSGSLADLMEVGDGLGRSIQLDRALRFQLAWQEWLENHEHVIDALTDRIM